MNLSGDDHRPPHEGEDSEEATSAAWQGLAPDRDLEQREEGEQGSYRRAWIQEDLLVYLFADGNVERWEDVALRAVAVMRRFTPGLLPGRKFVELDGMRERSGLQAKFTMEDFDKLTDCDERGVLLEVLLGYLFPTGSRWLKRGTRRVYLLARTFQPLLLRRHGRELSYERLEEIFEGRRLKTEEERNRARSRWSARAQKLIRKPVEANGGRIALQFGKSATARAKCAESAKGNTNRKGKKKC
jgi:hypothetical protein